MIRSFASAAGPDERGDPLACTSIDAAIALGALAISAQYTVALIRLGQESMWGLVNPWMFWIGLFAAPLAVLAPAWLLGRFTPANPVWLAIGLATPLVVWTVGLFTAPPAMLLVGGTAALMIGFTLAPARHGRRRRQASIRKKRLCRHCGYSLDGLRGGVCPECGSPRD
ncbi:MAG: hypothetical protein H6813_05065 [Phycisphaeraceae bacterium]|nr:hypothetical protein [Phycisphaeraceae bacterium]MCB9847754.1 hypothetical protein [Phycisphaeraceae bacterium]